MSNDDREREAAIVVQDGERPASSSNEVKALETDEKDKDKKEQERGKTSWGFRLRLFFALVLPVFLETLDYTVVATAQPHIASYFGRLDLQGWIGTSFPLTSTVFLPVYAALADAFGRHWALQTSLAWFLFGSALSTGAKTMEMMLAGRGIAGIGAAGCLTVVRTILADSRSLDENTFQASMMILLYSIGYSVGPVIGGALTSVSFRWIFAINLPCCVVGMVLLFALLRGRIKGPQASARERLREWDTSGWTWVDRLLTVDVVGATLFAGGGILILLALSWGSTTVWNSAKVIITFIIGGILLILCMMWEFLIEYYDDPDRREAPPRLLEAEPLIPIPIFYVWDTSICLFNSFTGGMLMLVAFYFVAIFFTVVSGQDPTKAGTQLVFFAPGVGGGVLLSMQMIRHLRQPRYALIFGSILMPVSIGLIAMAIDTEKNAQVNGFMAMAGVATGLTFAPLGIQGRFSQPVSRTAIIESLQLFFRSFGGTVGLAQCSAVLNDKVKARLTALVTSGDISLTEIAELAGHKGAASLASIDELKNLPGPLAEAIRLAFKEGTRWAFISLIPWTAVAALATFFLQNISDTDLMFAVGGEKAKKELEEKEKEAARAVEGTAPTTNPEQEGDAADSGQPPVGEKPTIKGVIGPVGLVIYLYKRTRWERRRRRAEQEAAHAAL